MCFILLLGTVIGDLTDDDVLYVYLTAWTRDNHTMTNQYLIKHTNTSRVAVCIQHTRPASASCLSTNSMSWQEVMRWNNGPCPDVDVLLVLNIQNPVKPDVYKCKQL